MAGTLQKWVLIQIAVGSLFIGISPALAQCIDYSQGVPLTALLSPPAGSRKADVAASGNYAIVAYSAAELQILDITNADDPVLLGALQDGPWIEDLAVSGDYVYASSGSAELLVVSIVDPTAPQIVGSVETSGQIADISVSGSLACVVNGAELEMIDVSDPTTPTLLGRYGTPDFATGVDIANNCAYVADWYSGLQVFDISDPLNPFIVGSVDIPYYATRVVVAGNFAFLVNYDGGLWVADVSDPAAPVIVSNLNLGGIAVDIKLSGNLAYIAATSTLSIVDVGNPAAPVRVGIAEAPGSCTTIAAAGNHAVAGFGYTGIGIFDVTSPTLIPAAADMALDGDAVDVVAGMGNLIYAVGHSGLYVVDTTTPATPILLSSLSSGTDEGRVIAWNGSVACIGYRADAGPGKARFMDMADPLAPTELGAIDLPGAPASIALSATHAYLAERSSPGGLTIVDIGSPQSPSVVGDIQYPGRLISDIVLSDGFLHVVTRSGDVEIYSVTDPSNPILVGALGGLGVLETVDISGSHLYMANQDEEFLTVDVSDIHNPLLVATRSYYASGAQRLAIEGHHAYLATAYGMVVFNISVPTDPVLVGGVYAGGLNRGIAVGGDLVILADAYSGLYLNYVQCDQVSAVDIRPRGGPVLHATYPNPFNPRVDVAFTMLKPGRAILKIYDVKGALVATLADEHFEEGRHVFGWTGRGRTGQPAASGVYFVRLQAGESVQVERMTLLK